MPDRSAEIQLGLLLADELELCEDHFDEYTARFPDQHVLICGKQLIGVLFTHREAIAKDHRLGAQKMLVRERGTRSEAVFMPTRFRASGQTCTAV